MSPPRARFGHRQRLAAFHQQADDLFLQQGYPSRLGTITSMPYGNGQWQVSLYEGDVLTRIDSERICEVLEEEIWLR